MSKFQRTKGRIHEPYYIVVYGASGVGKSTFASEAPGAVFIDIEGGSKNLSNAERYPQPENYKEFLEQLSDAKNDKNIKSIVIDTLDHLELLIHKEICDSQKEKIESIAEIPYGKGYDLAKEKWIDLLNNLEQIRKTKNVILLAHVETKQFNDPSLPTPYDRYQIKLDRRAVSLVKDRTDAILYMTYDTYINVDKNTKRAKGFGGEDRVIYTQYRAQHDGKNRFGLPYKIQLHTGEMWKSFEKAVQEGNPESIEVISSQVYGLLSKVPNDILKAKASSQIEAAKIANDIPKMIAIKNKLIEVTQE